MVADKNGKLELKKLDEYYLKSELSFHYIKNRELIVDLLRIKYLLKLYGKISPFDLNILESGLRHSWYEIYYQIAGKIILQFYQYQIIQDLCFNLIKDKHAKIRCNIFDVLLFNLKMTKSKELLVIALKDKSIKVVEVGIQYIEQHNLRKYLSVLEELITKFPKHSQSIENSIQFISKGYIFEVVPKHPNLILLTIKDKNTYQTQCFEKKILTKSFINQVIRKYKKGNY